MSRTGSDIARHRWWALNRAIAEAAARFNRSGAGAVRDAIRRASTARIDFRNRPILRREPDTDEAIRWLGPLASGAEIRTALFAHPDATVQYRVDAPAAGRISAWCTLIPAVWDKNRDGVVFEIEARREKSGGTSSARRHVQPGRRWTHRRWNPLRVDLPPGGADDRAIVVTLRTRTPPGGNADHAWAAWGDPAVEWSLGADRARAAAASFWQRVRTAGVRDTLRQLRASRADESRQLFSAWLETHTPTPDVLAHMAREQATWTYRPLISVITPVYNTDPKWLHAAVASVRRQAYPNWELCLCDDASPSAATRAALDALARSDARIKVTRLAENGGISVASNAALALARGEFIVRLDHDDELAPEALFELARLLNAHPDADVVYSDHDKLEADGSRSEPYFKPDWSPDLFLSYMYLCHMDGARRTLVEDVGGFRSEYNGAQDYDLYLRLTERTTRIHHIPAILYHWRKIEGSTAGAGAAKPWALDAGQRALAAAVARRGWNAEVVPGRLPGHYRVRFRVADEPLVSILILTRGGEPAAGQRDLLAECLGALVRRTTYKNYELVIASDTGRVSEPTARAIATARHEIHHYDVPAPFNFSRKTNFAAARARGTQLVLFNDDVEVITPDWIETLLEHAQRPEIGAVGAKLYYPDGRLQHVGMLLGVGAGTVAAHAFHQHPGASPGYFGSTIVTGNVSAVTAALMMTRREVFERVGGFNEALPIDFNDVDYCLKLRRDGLRIIFTPWAEAYHHESASFGARTQDPDRIAEMRRLWGAEIDRDPYLNLNLSREFPDYRIRL
jgi:GT2 family glycosyltransferase